jgi:hypothetical protein
MGFERLLRHPLRWLLPIQAALLLTRLDLLPIWGDEQFTLNVVALPWSGISSALAADIHPPLYFAVLKAWMALSLTEPIVWARLFSAVVALGTTIALDRLWLRGQPLEARNWFLALWCLSPLLLLDARMARSYSLQTMLTVLALAATARVCERPTIRRTVLLGLSISALLYTHYLPGVAIGAVAIAMAARRSWRAATGAAALAAAAYSPWLPVLFDGLRQASSKQVHWLASGPWGEMALRLGYWFTAFSFGEAQDWITISCALAISPWLLFLLFRGSCARDAFFVRAGLFAAPIGFFGTWHWVSFAFTPARLLFLLPAYLLAAALGGKSARGRYLLAGLLALNAAGIGMYFTQTGFLNLGYLVPYREMARQIESQAPANQTVVLVDAFNADPTPLTATLDPSYEVIAARDSRFAESAGEHLRTRRPAWVWRLRSSRDLSPGGEQRAGTEQLQFNYERIAATEYLPYSSLQRELFGLFSDERAPTAYYVSERWRRKDAD